MTRAGEYLGISQGAIHKAASYSGNKKRRNYDIEFA